MQYHGMLIFAVIEILTQEHPQMQYRGPIVACHYLLPVKTQTICNLCPMYMERVASTPDLNSFIDHLIWYLLIPMVDNFVKPFFFT